MNGDTSAEKLTAYLNGVTFEEARLDYLPATAIEQRMLARSHG